MAALIHGSKLLMWPNVSHGGLSRTRRASMPPSLHCSMSTSYPQRQGMRVQKGQPLSSIELNGPCGARWESVMQAILGGRRVASIGSSLLLALWIAACGDGDGDGGGGGGDDAGRVAVLGVHSSDAREAVLLDAAHEHGAPGENEPVRYRIKSSEPGVAQAAVLALRAHGFSDVEIE